MNSRIAAIVFRLDFAALSLIAVGVQFFAVAITKGHSIFTFFCCLTNLSNIMISIVFIVSAAGSVRPRA